MFNSKWAPFIFFLAFAGSTALSRLAATNFHPHTDDLGEQAQSVLDQHDHWADWTINFGIVALLLQITDLFSFNAKRWAFDTVQILSGYSVAQVAHYGAPLVHIEGKIILK